MTNAAIDATPSYDDKDDDCAPSGHQKLKDLTPEESEHQRRIHRQLLRKNMKIKPNHSLAVRLREQKERPKRSNSVMKRGMPKMGKGINSVEQLLVNAIGSKDFNVSQKAQRILQLGGYE